MKNLKVSMKLFLSFTIVTALTAVIGIVGIVGMGRIDAASHDLYTEQTKPLPDVSKSVEFMMRLRIQLYNAALATGDLNQLSSIESDVRSREESFRTHITAYGATLSAGTASYTLYNDALNAFENEFKPALYEIIDGAKAGRPQDELIAIMDRTRTAANTVVDNLTQCMEIKIIDAGEADVRNTMVYNSLLLLTIVILIGAVAISVFLAVYISGLINKPLLPLTVFMRRAAETGDIALTAEDKALFNKYAALKDEIGELIHVANLFTDHINEAADTLESVAGGDLTVDIHLASDRDTLGLSLQHMLANLNSMFAEISTATIQVSTGSSQIADGAQALAQGSTEQASTVDELSASISNISSKTMENTMVAKEAAKLSDQIRGRAEKGSTQMDDMMQAVMDINEASNQISQVIKVIDNIAFQTNILALNASVEAACAGQHGKGFAVVAEEVRNLAGKSADAAKDTGTLIENSITKANLGLSIATETSESLKGIVEGIIHSAEIVGRIARSSEDQSGSIAQINTAIDQVAQVVQQNSATAEQSAAASEEMSGQSAVLQQLISKFKLKKDGGYRLQSGYTPSYEPVLETGFSMSGGTGKY